MKPEVTLTHANTGQEAVVFTNKIFSYYYSEGHKAMMVVSDAGGVFPVRETREQLDKLLRQPKKKQKEKRNE